MDGLSQDNRSFAPQQPEAEQQNRECKKDPLGGSFGLWGFQSVSGASAFYQTISGAGPIQMICGSCESPLRMISHSDKLRFMGVPIAGGHNPVEKDLKSIEFDLYFFSRSFTRTR